MRLCFLLITWSICLACTKVGQDTSFESQVDFVLPDWLLSEQTILINQQDSISAFYPDSFLDDSLYLRNQGVLNAVKKAYQMTDIKFVPKGDIQANWRVYEKGEEYQGMIYSSVKEVGTYVGTDVSFYTFFTALNNPRSKLYTTHLDEEPYHGANCRAYYGTVCSGLVSYALGLVPSYGSYDFNTSSEMRDIHYSSPDDISIADVLWRVGHVAFITDVVRDINTGLVYQIEICEAIQNGCVKYTLLRDDFDSFIRRTFSNVFRYQIFYKNTDYTPIPEFLTLFDEKPIPFSYNNYLCVDKGDRSCYLEGETVVINVFDSKYSKIEVYKDGNLFDVYDNNGEVDIMYYNLPYGKYKARVITKNGVSDYTEWIVVDYCVSFDYDQLTVFFSSANSTPEVFSFRTQTGGRKLSSTKVYCHRFTSEEIENKKAFIPSDKIRIECPFYSITFKTDFGRISLLPQAWYN